MYSLPSSVYSSISHFYSNSISQTFNRLFPADLHFNKSENTIRHFRFFSDIKTKSEINAGSDHSVSSSGQFSARTLDMLIKRIEAIVKNGSKILIIDLRQESHGFINGEPAVWKTGFHGDGNKNKTIDEIKQDESDRFSRLGSIFFVWKKTFLPFSFPTPIFLYQSLSEEQQIQTLNKDNVQYQRIPITDHHRPTDGAVDEIIKLILNHPEAHLHFHCAISKG